MAGAELNPRDWHAEFEAAYVRPAPGRTLIVGSRIYGGREDRRQRYAEAIGVDMLDGPGVDMVADLEEPPAKLGRFHHIECCSVLEHSRRPWRLAGNLEKLLRHGGTIYVTAPFVWRIHAYPSDYWRFSIEGVRALFPRISWSALRFAHTKLTRKALVPAQGATDEGCPLMPRTEVLGFGVRQ